MLISYVHEHQVIITTFDHIKLLTKQKKYVIEREVEHQQTV